MATPKLTDVGMGLSLDEAIGLSESREKFLRWMISIRFPSNQTDRRVLGTLAGRFSFKSWATGQMIVPEDALDFLTAQGIDFIVEGPATYEQLVPVFRSASTPAQ